MKNVFVRSSQAWPLAVGILAVAAAARAQEPAAPPPPAATIAPAAEQIAAAVLAAPEDRRAGAQVLGYDAAGTLGVLRAGTNDIVCLADKPGDAKLSVACYHESLEPFMRRGRELEAQGVTGEERMKQRYVEADAGVLKMPKKPATLYVLTGTQFDAATGTVVDPYLRYVVYTPWATQESTGLPLSPPGPGGPWLMFPGTAGAHIMITPPKPETPAEPLAHDPKSHGS
jgi:hypothetical protein